eukprot:c9363_g1_i1 orf=337-525(+)
MFRQRVFYSTPIAETVSVFSYARMFDGFLGLSSHRFVKKGKLGMQRYEWKICFCREEQGVRR